MLQIALKELREEKIPFIIRRYLPDGRYACALELFLWFAHCYNLMRSSTRRGSHCRGIM